MLHRPQPLHLALGCLAISGLVACEGRLDPGLQTPRREAARCEQPSSFTPLHRLTPSEYDAMVEDVLGVTSQPARGFSVDDVGGFQNATQMNDAVLDQLETAAQASAQAADLVRIMPCTLAEGDAPCARSFVAQTGARLFRRPLRDTEVADLMTLYDAAREGGSRPFEEGVREVLQAMLMSPDFLYHSTTSPDDAPGTDVIAQDFELAAHLAFFFWNGAPDETLLQAAQRGELRTADQVEMHARRMLEDPRAERGILRFFTEWLDFDRLAGISRVGVDGYEPALNADLQRSLEAFIRHAAIEVGTVDALYSSNIIFVNARLARLYGIEGVFGDAMVAVEMPDAERHGLLTQPALMTLFSRTDHTDPIHRGLFVLNNVLCEQIGRPTRPVLNYRASKVIKRTASASRCTQQTRNARAATRASTRLDSPSSTTIRSVVFFISNQTALRSMPQRQSSRRTTSRGMWRVRASLPNASRTPPARVHAWPST